MPFSITVLGPVNVDYVAALTASVEEALLTFPTPYLKSPVLRRLGGKGTIAAAAAHAEGFQTTLVASIGGDAHPDEDGRFIEHELAHIGLGHRLRIARGFNTAKVFLTYFSENVPRLMVCDNDAIFQLDLLEDELTTSAHTADALFVSAYLALEQPSRDVARSAINLAGRAGVLTVVDLVPHDLVRHVGTEGVTEFVTGVSVLAMAPITLRHLFPNRNSEYEIVLEAYSKLRITERLLIVDKIAGTMLIYDGGVVSMESIGPIAQTAPASGAGERAIFRVASAILASERGNQK